MTPAKSDKARAIEVQSRVAAVDPGDADEIASIWDEIKELHRELQEGSAVKFRGEGWKRVEGDRVAKAILWKARRALSAKTRKRV
jgi:hypothetical protein